MTANYTLVAKTIRHPAHASMPPHDDYSLCGLFLGRTLKARYGWHNAVVVPESIGLTGVKVCQNCLRSLAATHDVSRLTPMPEEGATERGIKLSGRVRAITGQIWRVKGESDIYTVVVPSDTDIAPHCTCRANKIHPEILCKHLVKVLAGKIGVRE